MSLNRIISNGTNKTIQASHVGAVVAQKDNWLFFVVVHYANEP